MASLRARTHSQQVLQAGQQRRVPASTQA